MFTINVMTLLEVVELGEDMGSQRSGDSTKL